MACYSVSACLFSSQCLKYTCILFFSRTKAKVLYSLIRISTSVYNMSEYKQYVKYNFHSFYNWHTNAVHTTKVLFSWSYPPPPQNKISKNNLLLFSSILLKQYGVLSLPVLSKFEAGTHLLSVLLGWSKGEKEIKSLQKDISSIKY